MSADDKTASPPDGVSGDKLVALSYIYQAWMDCYQGHAGRMWQRFNFLLSVQTALIGGYASAAFVLHLPPRKLAMISTFGGLFAIAWYVLAAGDRWHMDHLQERLDWFAATVLRPALNVAVPTVRRYSESGRHASWHSWSVTYMSGGRRVGTLSSATTAFPILFFLFWIGSFFLSAFGLK